MIWLMPKDDVNHVEGGDWGAGSEGKQGNLNWLFIIFVRT
jgi:hypothetical protein